MRSITLSFLALLWLCVASEALATDIGGDLRIGLFSRDRRGRDGISTDSQDDARLRLRIAIREQLNAQWSAKVRVAGRYSLDEANTDHIELFDAIPSNEGLRLGDATIDEAYAEYRPSDRDRLRVGRMQTTFKLAGVVRKTLDRRDSPNTEITWTDGIYWRRQLTKGWVVHAIAQYNPKRGPTNRRLAPLHFSDDASRFSYHLILDSHDREGLWAQRAVALNLLPQSLHADGVGEGDVENYWAVVARAAAQWPVSKSGTRLLVGGALGYAPNTPAESVVGTGTRGDANGLAWLATANFIDLAPGHSYGIQLGEIDGGWLLTSNNSRLVEARYRWILAEGLQLDTRIRRREDLDRLTTAAAKQVDEDWFVRLTYRF